MLAWLLLTVVTATIPHVVLCLGDSITQGQTGVKSYPIRLQEALPTMRIVNRGRAGATSRGDLERALGDLRRIRPGAVVIQYGTNDPVAAITAAETVRNLRRLVDAAREAGVGRIVLVTPPPAPTEPRTSGTERIARAMLAADWPREVHVLDLRAQWPTLAGGWASHSDGFQLHPNDAGYRVMADAIRRALH